MVRDPHRPGSATEDSSVGLYFLDRLGSSASEIIRKAGNIE